MSSDKPKQEHEGSPRLVTRGESLTPDIDSPIYVEAESPSILDAHEFAAITDWLNLTIPVEDKPEPLEKLMSSFFEIVGSLFYPLVPRERGLHGWERSFDFGESGALFGIGGQQNRVFFSIPGHSCALIYDDAWHQLKDLIDEYQGRITRWDGAVDDFSGHYSVDLALEWYANNEFSTGGRTPKLNQHGNWFKPDGSGRTLYIGSRKNGKMLRVYEKGKQQGDSNSPWVRWELELHNKDRDIPTDVLIRPGHYVAGSYACMSWVREKASRIAVYKNTTRIGYDQMVEHARRGYGKLLHVMMEVESDANTVVKKLLRPGIPKRLNIPLPPEFVKEVTKKCKANGDGDA